MDVVCGSAMAAGAVICRYADRLSVIGEKLDS